MLEIFQYGFMVRAFESGIAIAVVAPVIGTFLVLRRLSLFADSLAHVALAGVAIGIITSTYPVITAVIACVIAAVAIEKLRSDFKVYSDAALSVFLSGSLAFALVLLSFAKGFNVNLFSYLFGSISAVEQTDIYVLVVLGLAILITIKGFYHKLIFLSFDEEAAKVSGVRVKLLNFLLMALAAVTVSMALRIVGVLMVGALMVVPVLSALQIARSIKQTLVFGVVFSVLSVVIGLLLSYYFDIVAGGAIVLVALTFFIGTLFFGKRRRAP